MGDPFDQNLNPLPPGFEPNRNPLPPGFEPNETPSPFDPSPGIGTPGASPIPAGNELAAQVHGDAVLGHMQNAIRDKLMSLADDLGGEFHTLFTTYMAMPDEMKAHTLYRPLGDRIASVEALLNTLIHTAASFPPPWHDHVPHGAL